jgi:molybdate transport system substrate-binding protein
VEEVLAAERARRPHRARRRPSTRSARCATAILAGERPAVALLSAEAIAAIAARGLVPADAVVEVGRTGVALAAPAAARPRHLDTRAPADGAAGRREPGLRRSGRGATAGRHFASLLDRLGITAEMRPKLRLVPFGVEGVAMAARGEVALAVSQATEIIDRPGVQLVGLLPDAVQLWTVYRAAAIRDGEEARALLALLTTEAARAAFARIGFRPA